MWNIGKTITQPLLKPFGGGSVSVFQASLAVPVAQWYVEPVLVAQWYVLCSKQLCLGFQTRHTHSGMVVKGGTPGYFQCFY